MNKQLNQYMVQGLSLGMKTLLSFIVLMPCLSLAAGPDDEASPEVRAEQMVTATAVGSLFDGVTSIELVSLYPRSGWDSDEVIFHFCVGNLARRLRAAITRDRLLPATWRKGSLAPSNSKKNK